jgi:hypothetical protein
MIIDNYNIRLGMAYARELIESSPANISAEPIIENLQRSLVNKPLAQRVGIMIVIKRLKADQKQEIQDKWPESFGDLMGVTA